MASYAGDYSLKRLMELQLEIGALLGINVLVDNTPLLTRWQKVKRWLKR